MVMAVVSTAEDASQPVQPAVPPSDAAILYRPEEGAPDSSGALITGQSST